MEISKLFDIRISKKLPILFMVISAVSVVSVGVFSVFNTSASLMHQEEQTLVALAEARNSALQDYVKSIEEDILISAGNGYVQNAMSNFALGFRDEERRHKDPLKSLHGIYINDPTAEATNAEGNPEKIGEKHLYNGPEIEGSYHSDHRRFHPWFRQMLAGRGYYDIFLVDVEGNVVYTVFKELDYATNLNSGKYKDSGLAQAFKAAMNSQKSGSISFIDLRLMHRAMVPRPVLCQRQLFRQMVCKAF